MGESALKGGIARRHRRSGPARARRTARIRRRDRGPEAGRVRTHLKERGESTRPTAGGQRTPERGSDRREENASKREARGRSGARKGARRDGGGRREGGTQTSHAARRGAGRLRGLRVPRSGMCRGARKPREGSIVGRAGPSGSPRRCGGVAMGLCREAKAQGGPEDGAIRPTDPARECPEGVETPCGPTEPMSVVASRGRVLGAPRKPRRGPRVRRKAASRVAPPLKPSKGRSGIVRRNRRQASLGPAAHRAAGPLFVSGDRGSFPGAAGGPPRARTTARARGPAIRRDREARWPARPPPPPPPREVVDVAARGPLGPEAARLASRRRGASRRLARPPAAGARPRQSPPSRAGAGTLGPMPPTPP